MYLASDEDVKNLRAALSKIWYIPIDFFDDFYLKYQLYLAQGSILLTSQDISNHCMRRVKLPEINVKLSWSNGKYPAIMDQWAIFRLDKATPSGATIFLMSVIQKNVSFSTLEMLKQVERTKRILQWERPTATALSRHLFVFDCKNLSIKHIEELDFMLLRKNLSIHDRSAHIEALHIIHVPEFTSILINLFNFYASTKLRSRLVVHPNLESLHKVVPKECLPEDFGGYNSCLQNLIAKEKKAVESYAQKFQDYERFWEDFLSKNKSSLCSDEDVVFENFRKLEFD